MKKCERGLLNVFFFTGAYPSKSTGGGGELGFSHPPDKNFRTHSDKKKKGFLTPSDIFFSCDPHRKFCQIYPLGQFFRNFYPPRTVFVVNFTPLGQLFFTHFTPLGQFILIILPPSDIFPTILPPCDSFCNPPPYFSPRPPKTEICIFLTPWTKTRIFRTPQLILNGMALKSIHAKTHFRNHSYVENTHLALSI